MKSKHKSSICYACVKLTGCKSFKPKKDKCDLFIERERIPNLPTKFWRGKNIDS